MTKLRRGVHRQVPQHKNTQLNTLLTRTTPRRVPRPPIPQNCYFKKRLFFLFNRLAYSVNKDEYKTVSLGITRPAQPLRNVNRITP